MKHLTKLEKAVSAWPRVWVRPHRFGGREFGLGSAELGHVHTGGIVDIPFPPRIKEALLAEGLAEEHRWAPDSGWVTFRVRRAPDLQRALWLMRLSYLRYMLKIASDPLQLLETESEQLHLSPRLKSMLEQFVPKSTQTPDVPSADTAGAD